MNRTVLAILVLAMGCGAPQGPAPPPSAATTAASAPAPPAAPPSGQAAQATVLPPGQAGPSAASPSATAARLDREPAIAAFPPLVEAVRTGRACVSEGVQMSTYHSGLQDLLVREQWDLLEAEVARLRKTNPTFVGPSRKLTSFYFGLEGTEGYPSDRNFLYHLIRVDAWRKARPQSAAARAVLARSLLLFVQDKVPAPTPEHLRMLPDDLVALVRSPGPSAVRLLDQARALAPRDPELYAVSINALRLTGGSRTQADALKAKGAALAAGYAPVVGQWLRFRRRDELDFAWWSQPEEPAVLAISWNLYLKDQTPPAEAWLTLKKGYLDLLARHPKSLLLRSEFARAALALGDTEEARRQLLVVGTWLEQMAWQRDEFEKARKAVGLTGTPSPGRDLPVRDSSIVWNHRTSRATLLWQIRDLLAGQRFADLDAIGRALREKRSRLPDGASVNATWYSLISADPDAQQDEALRQAIAGTWLMHSPDTIDGRIALAQVEFELAARSRGGGWASDVSESQWQGFEQHHKVAERLFGEVLDSGQKLDPEILALGIRLCLDRQDGKTEARALLDQAIRLDPKAPEPYVSMANLLLPRWQGEPGEFHAFLEEASAKFGPGIVALVAEALGEARDVLEEEKLTPKRILNSWDALCKAQPAPKWTNTYARYACGQKDRAHARRAFAAVGSNWEPSQWKLGSNFRKYKAWAEDGAPFPSR